MRPAVFLDRDGVINHNRPDYVKSWSEFRFLPGALGALRELAELGLPVVVVTNQSAIGRGLVAERTVNDINRRMVAGVRAVGGRIDAVLVCPHCPDDRCDCRKPRPGLLLQASAALHIDLAASVLIGDSAADMGAAHAAGCRAMLVKSGLGAEQLEGLWQRRGLEFAIAEDLNGTLPQIRRLINYA